MTGRLSLPPNPFLPPELERRIFELAFVAKDGVTSGNMVLVAKRVRIWIRPLIYSVCIQLKGYSFYPNIATKWPNSVDLAEIYGFAKHVIVDGNKSNSSTRECQIDIGTHCPNIESLALWPPTDFKLMWPGLSRLRVLRRLVGSLLSVSHTQLLSAAFVSTLTHLEVIRPTHIFPFDALPFFSCLTHINFVFGDTPKKIVDVRSRIDSVLPSCLSLQIYLECVCVVALSSAEVQRYAANPKMVIIIRSLWSSDGWIRGAWGGADIWCVAERVAYARKYMYFESDEYLKNAVSQNFIVFDHLNEVGKRWYLSLEEYAFKC